MWCILIPGRINKPFWSKKFPATSTMYIWWLQFYPVMITSWLILLLISFQPLDFIIYAHNTSLPTNKLRLNLHTNSKQLNVTNFHGIISLKPSEHKMNHALWKNGDKPTSYNFFATVGVACCGFMYIRARADWSRFLFWRFVSSKRVLILYSIQI